MTLPFGLIIAGGAGQRLGGVRKAELRLGGVRLLDRVAGAFGPVAEPLLIATGPHPAPPNLPRGAVPIPDLPYPPAGPLAGLAAAVLALQQRGVQSGVLVSAPVDTPFLPEDFAGIMVQALGPDAAVYARHGADFHPPVAAWRLEAIAFLPASFAEGSAPVSLRALQEQLGSRAVEWRVGESNPFLNINTIADLLALQRTERERLSPLNWGTRA